MARKKDGSSSSTPTYVRIVALILGILMIVGVAVLLIEFLALGLNAEEVAPSENTEENKPPEIDTSEDIRVRIGLIYGSSVVDAIPVSTDIGFDIGLQQTETDGYSFTPMVTLMVKKLWITSDQNLKKSTDTYKPTTSSSGITVGGYHIQVQHKYNSYADVMKAIHEVSSDLAKVNLTGGCYAYPCYISDGYFIRIYDFASQDSATNKVSKFTKIFPNEELRVTTPNVSVVSVVNPETDRIVLQFSSTVTGENLGLKSVTNPNSTNGEDYVTLESRLYQDVLAFKKEKDSHKFAVVNVIRLEEYVEGVMPYEISTSWPIETQKAFAISIRTYILTNLKKRQSAYGFDLVNTSADQVYKGAGSVNASVRQAVTETRGIVLTYEGELAEIYYANCFGDCSVGAKDVWSGKYPEYLKAVRTPWESYTDSSCKGGFWINEVSAKDLCTYLKKEQGYTQLKGTSIASVEIKSYAENSSYVNQVLIKDNLGNEVELNRCSKIRGAFIKYVYSANFVVGKGSVIYTLDTVTKIANPDDIEKGVKSITEIFDLVNAAVHSMFGINQGDLSGGVHVLTAEGNEIVTGSAAVLYSNIVTIGPKYRVSTETKVYKCASATNFVFIGKGYGHGVGISQYGAKCLGEFGYTFDEILRMYFTDIEFSHRSDIQI